MTRRIALAILLTCWLVLLTGGTAAYFAVRQSLLDELDASLVRRASLLPEVAGAASSNGGAGYAVPAGDRYVVRNHRGQTVANSGMRTPASGPAAVRSAHFATLADGSRVRSVTIAFAANQEDRGGEMLVVYSTPADRYDQLIGRLWLTFVSVALAAGLLTAGVALAVARAALRPLTAAANTVASIDDRSLDRRLDVAALPAELHPMAERLNQMLARLEQGLHQRKQFMADAAHELRTPVSALMTSMEVALRRPREAQALTGVMQDCVGEVRVLRRLVDALLEQFRADAQAASAAQTVDVSAIFDLCIDAVASAAKHKGVEITRSYPSDLRIVTEPQRLRSIVSNLLDNALAYNVPGGSVILRCAVEGNALSITVRDTGRGIRADLLPHVFDPFFRGSDGHSLQDDNGHCGLGLYLVKSHTEALGGTCTVSSEPGAGSEFQVRLPVGIPAIAAVPAVICALFAAFSCSWPILCGVN